MLDQFSRNAYRDTARAFAQDALALVLAVAIPAWIPFDLIGMGADGREGARLLKQQGARIWAQDEASCVVYGMPQAIAAAGLMDQEVSLNEVASRLITEVKHG